MFKAFHQLKQLLKTVLPESLVAFIIRMKGEKLKMIDLSYVNLIRDKSKERLIDAAFLERELLPQLGLNNELPHEFPSELYSFSGHGLLYWQYPSQFSKYLVSLAGYGIRSYLEIGVRHGGSFVATTEYLQKFNPIQKAAAIDIAYSPGVVAYKEINPAVSFLQADSRSMRFRVFLEKAGVFDLALIDGNHEEAVCRQDFYLLHQRANIIALHDIASDVCPGVKKVWAEIKARFAGEYDFYEFTDQYESVSKREGKSFLGIGTAVRRSFLPR
jgi:hypothetical protein